MIKENDFKLKIRGILTGPIVIIIVMIVFGVIILIIAVPKLSLLLEKLELTPPLTTKIMIALSRFFIQEWRWMLLSLVGLFFLFKIVFKKIKPRKFLDKLLLRSPFTNQIVRKINTAYTVKKLSFLTATGVSFAESFENIAGTIGNFYYKKALTVVAKEVKNGRKASEALRPYQNLYPSIFIQMLEVGEETGQLPKILEKLDYFFNEETSRDIKNSAIFAELVLMIIFGVVAGFFAISAIQPLISFVF